MPTPDEIPELIRRAGDALNRDDLDGYLALMEPDVDFTSMIAEVEGETFRGHEGIRRWWDTVRASFEEAKWEFVDIQPEGEDRVVVCLRSSGVLGGVPVEQVMWQALKLRDAKARWWRFFRTEEEAREALG